MLKGVVLLSLALSGTPQDLFQELYQRSRIQEKELQTLRAHFTETTVSTLLRKPLIASGTLTAARPLTVRLEYTSPEKKIVLLDRERLVVSWPDRGEREELNVVLLQKRVDQYFTRGSLEDLESHFTIKALPDPELQGAYRIDMVPKRKQIEKGLERLQIWLDPKSLSVIQMRMAFPGGDSKTLKLESIELNVPVGF